MMLLIIYSDNSDELINQVLETVTISLEHKLTPMFVLKTLVSFGNRTYVDVALKCHEKAYFVKEWILLTVKQLLLNVMGEYVWSE